MKIKISFIVLFAMSIIAFSFNKISFQNGTEPWAEKQLMQPSDLAKILNDTKSKKPLIYSIGPGGLIKTSINIGEGQNKENIAKFKKALNKLPKETGIVIYCGCCPFKNCPNIRPAFNLLNEMKFINHKLLNLSQNFKVDWIDKGYPMTE